VALSLSAYLREAVAEGVFVSFCPQLNMFSQGRTAEEARNALKSAVLLWIKACYDRRVFDKALHEAGFTRMEAGLGDDEPGTITVHETPGNDYGDEFTITVPVHLLAANCSGGVNA
jgi:predicted RNase H-like HicB family nuclease